MEGAETPALAGEPVLRDRLPNPLPTSVAPHARTSWLPTPLPATPRSFATEPGWAALEVTLEEGEGTVLVQTRREADHVAVSVGFSDPALRTFAQEQAERLRETLEQHYGTTIDLHLANDTPHQHTPSRQEHPPFPATPFSGRPGSPQPAPSPPAQPTGIRHGWIG
jgi:hypothetical protein